MRSRPDIGALPMDQLTKRIQESKNANRFGILEEENLNSPSLPLLNNKKIKEATRIPERMFG